MQRDRQDNLRWWIVWSIASPLCLVLGMAISVMLLVVLFLLLFGLNSPQVAQAVQETTAGILIGLSIGTVLGFAQERLLRDYLPRLRYWRWTTLIPWLILFALTPTLDYLSRNQSLYSTIVQNFAEMPIAEEFPTLILGLWTSGMQAFLLRRYIAHAERWLFMGVGWYALALMFSAVNANVATLLSFAIANSISGWFLSQKFPKIAQKNEAGC